MKLKFQQIGLTTVGPIVRQGITYLLVKGAAVQVVPPVWVLKNAIIDADELSILRELAIELPSAETDGENAAM